MTLEIDDTDIVIDTGEISVRSLEKTNFDGGIRVRDGIIQINKYEGTKLWGPPKAH